MITSVLARPVRAAALAGCAGVLALGLAACGGSSESADPADAVPSSAPFYAQVTLRPDGDLQRNANAALKKVLRTDDPSAWIEQQLSSSDSKVSFKDDVEPWLGDEAALFFTSFSGTQPDGAIVIASKDNDKAQELIDQEVGADAAKRAYKDVDYRMDGDTATGIVEDFVVLGSERGFRTVVDTLKGDNVQTIEDGDDYQKALDAVGDEDALATVYLSTQGLIDAIGRSGGVPPETLTGLRQTLVQNAGSASVAKLGVSANAIAVDTATLGVKASTDNAGSAASAALEALPSDAWLGLGLSSVGERLRGVLQQATQLGSVGGTDVDGQLEALQQQLGIDLDQDLFSWMGDAGLFVRGTAIADIGGALVVKSSDPVATKRALTKVRRLIKQLSPTTQVRALSGVRGVDTGLEITPSGLPIPILMAVAGDKFVVGVSPASIEAAIAPTSTLAGSATFKQAAAALDGVDPTFFLDIGPIVQLADGLGAFSDPEAAKVRSYLNQFVAIAAGSKRDGDIVRGKLVVTMK